MTVMRSRDIPRSELLLGVGSGKDIFGTFPIACPACHDAGHEVTMGFLDHTLRFGDPIIRAAAFADGGPDRPGATLCAVGEPLTECFDDVAYLSCTDTQCGRRFGPYTARDLRHRLLRSWR